MPEKCQTDDRGVSIAPEERLTGIRVCQLPLKCAQAVMPTTLEHIQLLSPLQIQAYLLEFQQLTNCQWCGST